MPGESGAFDRQQRPCVPQKPVAQRPCCSLQPAQQFSLAFIRVGWSGGGLGGDGGWLGGSGEHRATVVRVVSTLACHPPTGEVLLLLPLGSLGDKSNVTSGRRETPKTAARSAARSVANSADAFGCCIGFL